MGFEEWVVGGWVRVKVGEGERGVLDERWWDYWGEEKEMGEK